MAEQQTGSVMETRPGREETVHLMRAHDIRDIKVRNPEGENLGDIDDVAIDRESGCIAYAVLSYGGILGFGEKHFAIPWEAVRTRPGERTAVVDADKRTLDSEPGFSRDRMPHEGDWSLIRTPPPVRRAMGPSAPVTERERPPSEVGTAATAAAAGAAVTGAAAAGATARKEESYTARKEESYVPVPPPVQTVAAGWGGEQRAHTAKERAEAFPPRETVVEEVRRERPVETETRPVTERPLTTAGPSPGHLSAADLQVYLKGMDYPAGREDLVAHARKNNAPASVIAALEGFSDRSYRSAAEVSEEFGSEVRRGRPARTETVVEERPVSRARAPSPAHLSAADLQTYLKGMDYPAGRQDLVTHARKNNAPESVIAALEGFGDRTYRSAADVSVEFGRESRGEETIGTEIRRETVVEEVRRERPSGMETRARAPSLAHISAADLQTYLKGMDYPASRQDLVAHARKNNAPESVIAALEQFGDRSYRSAVEVSEEFGKIK